MPEHLCISVTFLDERFHGRADGGEPEWPPSPLRLFQALVAANRDAIGAGGEIDNALLWLERQAPPTIFVPRSEIGTGYRLSVPSNAMDLVGKAWSKGNFFGSGDANPSTHRTMKAVRPIKMIGDDTVRYCWRLPDSPSSCDTELQTLAHAAGRVFSLGWGIDMVVGHGELKTSDGMTKLPGERWDPCITATGCLLRTPVPGTFNALRDRHESFLNRIGEDGFMPVTPLSRFAVSDYRKVGDPTARPHRIFELRNDDGSFLSYAQRKLIHIAGMVRHLAIKAMKNSPPPEIANIKEWIDTYVAGHARYRDGRHRQFSYLPLPSIGHRHADQAVRRVMIAAPAGDDQLLEHLANRLSGLRLEPENETEFGRHSPPTLVRVRRDKVTAFYTRAANTWASVTPLILPGHDDHKPAKTTKLIETALRQSGIEQPCTYEWRAASWFSKSLSAHKYDRDRRPAGYVRPDHLLSQTAVHLYLQFRDNLSVPGPLVIGAGRHCGLGLCAEAMAAK